jgi:hypothetical protein
MIPVLFLIGRATKAFSGKTVTAYGGRHNAPDQPAEL